MLSKKAKSLLAILLFYTMVIISIEGLGVWLVENHGDAIDRSQPLLKVDADLGWRQRAHLHTFFYNTLVETNELGHRSQPLRQTSPKTVVFLGPSSTFGWGVKYDHIYSSVVSKEMQNSPSAEKNIQVYNAGEIGFSSLQGVLLLDKHPQILSNAKFVVIAYGINDLDRHRFFYNSPNSDKKEFSKKRSRHLITLHNLLNQSSFLSFVSRKVSLFMRRTCEIIKDPRKEFYRRRVEIGETIDNMRLLIRSIRSSSSRVVVVSTPYLYQAKSLEAFEESNEFKSAVRFYKDQKYEEAFKRFQRLSQKDSSSGLLFLYWQSSAAALGRCQVASQADKLFRLAEFQRIADEVILMNGQLRQLAEKEGVGFVDAHGLLASEPENFVDPVHPSAKGHEIVGKAIARALTKM
jgi:lysophospholipase L1-like esterase